MAVVHRPSGGYVLALAGADAPVALVGGKASALDRLVASDLPVPAAAALTVDAYRMFMSTTGLSDFVADLEDRVPPGELVEDADRVQAAFLNAVFPSELHAALTQAWEAAVGQDPAGLVSVRSSATAEDMAGASFAGQYHTSLNVERALLERSVRLCWASLWAPGVRAYRSAHEMGGDDVAMGVIVQRMVRAERSGVLFTRDPTGGLVDWMRVEVVDGLGESLVSGAVTPDVYRVHRERIHVEEPTLPPMVSQLAKWALEIEAIFGSPQDIEFSVERGSVRILQARPITTETVQTDGFDSLVDPITTYAPGGLNEMLPGVIPPLLWTINSELIESAFAEMFAACGVRCDGDDGPMVARFSGQAALNLDRLKRAAAQMPGGSPAEVERQYLGYVVTEDTAPRPGTSLLRRAGRMPQSWAAFRLRQKLRLDAAAFVEAVGLALDLHPDYRKLGTQSLLTYRSKVRQLAGFGVTTEIAVAAAAAANYRATEITLQRWVGDEAPIAVQRLTAGGAGGYAGSEIFRLWDEIGLVRRSAEVSAALHAGPAEQAEDRLRALGAEGEKLLSAVEAALRKSGSMALYGGPTWREEPVAFWGALQNCDRAAARSAAGAHNGSAAAYLNVVVEKVTATWSWRLTRVLTGQLVDVRGRLLRGMVKDARDFLRIRERVKAAVLRLGGEEWRLVREAGRRLAAKGRLSCPADVVFLADSELEGLLRTGEGPSRVVIETRKAVLTAWQGRAPLPEIFEAGGLNELSSGAVAGSTVVGWATAPGRAVGRAWVAGSVREAAGMHPGDVLVGHSTDPSWTPLFLAASAIVMEEGGPLSHAAIIARELGLPAVLKARGATQLIKTGDLVCVDGTAGTVELVNQSQVAAA